MSSNKEPKPVTWPWVITAWMMPLLIASGIAVYVITEMREGQLPRVDAARSEMIEAAKSISEVKKSLGDVIAKSGVTPTVPAIGSFTTGQLETSPIKNPEPSEVEKRWTDFVRDVYNSETYGVAVNKMERQRAVAWAILSATLASYKSYNHRFGLDLPARAADAPISDTYLELAARSKRERRIGDLLSGALAGNLDPALGEGFVKALTFAPPLDPRMPTNVATFENLIWAQRDLIQQLAALTSDLNTEVTKYLKASSVYDNRVAALETTFNNLKTALEGTGEGSAEGTYNQLVLALGAIAQADRSATTRLWSESEAKISAYQSELLSDIENRILGIDAEVRAHQRDAFEFRRLLQENKIQGAPGLLTTELKPDAKISWVNRDTRQCHIDIGSADNVHPGMRFEVWQMAGIGREEMKAVIEVVRVISPTYSLCTILDFVDHLEPVREGDSAINILWEKGRYIRVALHGKLWDPSNNIKYSKLRLRQILTDLGVPVQDQMDTNTEAVILGQGWGLDPLYSEARTRIRVDTYSERRIRLYIDPR